MEICSSGWKKPQTAGTSLKTHKHCHNRGDCLFTSQPHRADDWSSHPVGTIVQLCGWALFALDKAIINPKSESVSRCSWRLEVKQEKERAFPTYN